MPTTLHLNATRPEDIRSAAEILRAGGLVAFPTETVYGLGANALSAEAVAKIFEAKQRPSWDPLIVHLPGAQEIERIAQLDGDLEERVARLGEAFWPGPLTLLLPRRPVVPDAVTAGRATVGVRVPAHPVAQGLLQAAGVPIAAPSANRFGHVSPTTAQHVLDDLDGRIDAVLDGGPTLLGLESTVLDPSPTPMVVYRAGGVTLDALRAATGVGVDFFSSGAAEVGAEPASLPSPGVGIRHYAPAARVVLSDPEEVALWREVAGAGQHGAVGVLLPGDWAMQSAEEAVVVRWGRWSDSESLARELFSGLRTLEAQGVRTIVCPLPEPGGLRDALRDRLLKAARTA